MATTWGKPSLSMVARAAFLRSRKNAACSSGLSWICCRRLVAIRDRPLSCAQVCRELHRHVVDVPGSREVVEVMEVEGAVLSHELDVVVETRVPDGFHVGRPRGVN